MQYGVDALTDQLGRMQMTDIGRVFEIRNAHHDDIHGFVQLSDDRFASGSKDTSVKVWNIAGNHLANCMPQDKPTGYKFWVTALCKVDAECFASGTRDGDIIIWDLDGNEQASFAYRPSNNSKRQTASKHRNKQRINCIATDRFGDKSCIFTGTPRFV